MHPREVDEKRRAFETVADGYDAMRPGYADALVDDVLTLGAVPAGGATLEIGCGSGQATVAFADRGLDVLALELGEDLSELARRRLGSDRSARVVTADFETWKPPDAPFDLVYAATSWRWLDAERRLAKVARLLRPGGALAIFSSTHTFPAGETDPFFHEIQSVYESIGAAHAAWPPPAPDKVPGHAHEIAASGWFGAVAQRRYVFGIRYSADAYVALLSTFPDHLALDPSTRAHLFHEIRRRIRRRPRHAIVRHWVTVLDVARLVPYVEE